MFSRKEPGNNAAKPAGRNAGKNAAKNAGENAGENDRAIIPHSTGGTPANRISDAILNFIGQVPKTSQHLKADPHNEARRLARVAARKASAMAGGFALPPGPLGWLTVLPELLAVWKIQKQLIADIAGVYGSTVELTREQMLYCLFRHTAAQAVRDLVVRMGERYIVRRVTSSAFQLAARRVGVSLTKHAIGSGVSRWLPIVGAVGVGAYAYWDTTRVAKTAIELFGTGVEIEVEGEATFDRIPRGDRAAGS